MFDPEQLPAFETQNVPGPVKVATLKFVSTVVKVLPLPETVAVTKAGNIPVALEVESIVFFQPSVPST